MVRIAAWIRNLIRSWAGQSNSKFISEILASNENKEIFLGVSRRLIPSKKEIDLDLERAARYSQSDDYAVWAKEAWSNVLDSIDKLCQDNLTDRQVDFYRGILKQTIKMLSVSHRARNLILENSELNKKDMRAI